MKLALFGLFLIALQSRPGRFENGFYTTCPNLQELLKQNTAYIEKSESDILRRAKSEPFVKCPLADCGRQDVKVLMEIRGENVFCATADNGPVEMQQAAVDAAMKIKFKKHGGDSNVSGTMRFRFK